MQRTACSGKSNPAADGPAAPALDLHEGIFAAGAPERFSGGGGCPRWPENLRLLSSRGELVPGRCRSTNLCEYCARLAAVENSELLQLDALNGVAPAVWAVLTTRSTCHDPKAFYRARQAVYDELRKRWPACEYAALVEFTTGAGRRGGGQRRPHWNLLLKGIPAHEWTAASWVIVTTWCAKVDAVPQAQYVGTVAEYGGLMRYLALHFQKESQAPPPGWRGHRFLKSHGYLWTGKGGTPEARRQARESLAHKRALWKSLQQPGKSAADAELDAAMQAKHRAETTWALVDVTGPLTRTSRRVQFMPSRSCPTAGLKRGPMNHRTRGLDQAGRDWSRVKVARVRRARLLRAQARALRRDDGEADGDGCADPLGHADAVLVGQVRDELVVIVGELQRESVGHVGHVTNLKSRELGSCDGRRHP